MKVVMGIIGVIVIVLFLSPLRAGLLGARTNEYEQVTPAVTTAAGVTSANVTLLKPLWEDDIASVTALTSSDGDDTPAVYSFASDVLLVTGLQAETSRTLTLTYRYGALTGTNAPADTFLNLLFIFIGIALLVFILAMLYSSWQKRGG